MFYFLHYIKKNKPLNIMTHKLWNLVLHILNFFFSKSLWYSAKDYLLLFFWHYDHPFNHVLLHTKWSRWCITASLNYKNTMINKITMETVACLRSKCHLKQNLIQSWPWSFRHTSRISAITDSVWILEFCKFRSCTISVGPVENYWVLDLFPAYWTFFLKKSGFKYRDMYRIVTQVSWYGSYREKEVSLHP
jgi:hypothetical protein